MSEILIESFTAPGFAENAYLVRRRHDTRTIIVDPGGQAEAMLDHVDRHALSVDAIVLTHAHIDHIEGVSVVKERTGAPIWLHAADAPLYRAGPQQAQLFGLTLRPLPPIDHELTHGQHLAVAGIDIEVRHVPGHAPGHVILYIAEGAAALVGDVVFQGSIGRTDLPGGDFKQLVRGIRAQVFSLPPDTTLYPGHGPPTSAGHEQATNPFLIPQYGGGLA